jgi:hypothetical protein
MRSLIYVVALGLLSTPALAQNPAPSPAPAAAAPAATGLPSLPPIDPASIPDQCKAVATVPNDAKIATPMLAARIALATCGAEVRFGALKVGPPDFDASIAAMNDAAKPSFDLLDAVASVLTANDATFAPMVQKARRDIFVSMAVRMRNSIPPITMTTVGQPLADHDRAHADLEPKIKPWLDQAKALAPAPAAAPQARLRHTPASTTKVASPTAN